MEAKMKEATLIIIVSITAVLFLQTAAFAENLLNTVIHKENTIIGVLVKDIQGEEVGHISSLTFDKDTGNITYVNISHADITRNGDKSTPVPIDALRFINEKNAQLNISKKRLYASPIIEQ